MTLKFHVASPSTPKAIDNIPQLARDSLVQGSN